MSLKDCYIVINATPSRRHEKTLQGHSTKSLVFGGLTGRSGRCLVVTWPGIPTVTRIWLR